MAKSKLKVNDNLWIDFSQIVGMELREEFEMNKTEKEELAIKKIYSVIALTSAGNVLLLRDISSGVPDKCHKFILENWVER